MVQGRVLVNGNRMDKTYDVRNTKGIKFDKRGGYRPTMFRKVFMSDPEE